MCSTKSAYGEESGEGWIGDVTLDDESLRFRVADNTTGAMRFATITLWVADGNGTRYETRRHRHAKHRSAAPDDDARRGDPRGGGLRRDVRTGVRVQHPEIYGDITLVCDYLTGAEGWLTNYRIDREAGLLSVKVPANPTAPRSARIALRYDDGEGGGITTGYVTLTQEKCDIGGVEGDRMENEKDDNEW